MPWVGLEPGHSDYKADILAIVPFWFTPGLGGINYLKLYYFAATPSRIKHFGLVIIWTNNLNEIIKLKDEPGPNPNLLPRPVA